MNYKCCIVLGIVFGMAIKKNGMMSLSPFKDYFFKIHKYKFFLK